MRDLLERSWSARAVVAVGAGCCVLALAQAAAARNDLDMREAFRAPAPQLLQTAAPRADGGGATSLRAAAHPLRITLQRTRHQERHVAGRRTTAPKLVARRAPLGVRAAVLPPSRDAMFEPIPQKPAIVSIYEDQTLRRGDAVMMRDGLRVFSGLETGSHRQGDFVLLGRAGHVDWHLRKTLSAFDNNPPDHWRT